MLIRKFDKGDRAAFTLMHRDFYSSPAVVHGITEVKRQLIFDTIVNGSPYLDGYIFLEDDGKGPKGYALVARGYSTEAGGPSVWLEELYIAPRARGQGLASEFLEFLLKNYKDAKRFALEVSPNNIDVVRLYMRHGFLKSEYIQFINDTE